MDTNIQTVSDLDFSDLSIGDENKIMSNHSCGAIGDLISFTLLGNDNVELKFVNDFSEIYKLAPKHRLPYSFIDIVKDLESTINTVKLHTIKYDSDSVKFIDDNHLEIRLIVHANKFSDIQKIIGAYQIDFSVEFTKLYDAFCLSLGLEPIIP